MNTLNKYINKLQQFEVIDESNLVFSNLMPISDAVNILEEFEADLMKELSEDELSKLRKEGIL